MSQEITLMQSAWGQRRCLRPQHSPSEQHMLTMISKDVCWAVSKATASLSSSLPLWTKTKQPCESTSGQNDDCSRCFHPEFSGAPQRRDSFLQMWSNMSRCTFQTAVQVTAESLYVELINSVDRYTCSGECVFGSVAGNNYHFALRSPTGDSGCDWDERDSSVSPRSGLGTVRRAVEARSWSSVEPCWMSLICFS